MSVTMWQTTDLDEQIAVKLFGWQWWSWEDVPQRNHPSYPKKVLTRQFLSPEQLETKRWQDFLAKNGAVLAGGNEPLGDCDYTVVPHFSGHLDDARQLVAKVVAELGCKFSLGFDGKKWVASFYAPDKTLGKCSLKNPCVAICRAALAAVGGKE